MSAAPPPTTITANNVDDDSAYSPGHSARSGGSMKCISQCASGSGRVPCINGIDTSIATAAADNAIAARTKRSFTSWARSASLACWSLNTDDALDGNSAA